VPATHGDEGDQAYRAIRRRLDAKAERFGVDEVEAKIAERNLSLNSIQKN
jgi:hypothetical protein